MAPTTHRGKPSLWLGHRPHRVQGFVDWHQQGLVLACSRHIGVCHRCRTLFGGPWTDKASSLSSVSTHATSSRRCSTGCLGGYGYGLDDACGRGGGNGQAASRCRPLPAGLGSCSSLATKGLGGRCTRRCHSCCHGRSCRRGGLWDSKPGPTVPARGGLVQHNALLRQDGRHLGHAGHTGVEGGRHRLPRCCARCPPLLPPHRCVERVLHRRLGATGKPGRDGRPLVAHLGLGLEQGMYLLWCPLHTCNGGVQDVDPPLPALLGAAVGHDVRHGLPVHGSRMAVALDGCTQGRVLLQAGNARSEARGARG